MATNRLHLQNPNPTLRLLQERYNYSELAFVHEGEPTDSEIENALFLSFFGMQPSVTVGCDHEGKWHS